MLVHTRTRAARPAPAPRARAAVAEALEERLALSVFTVTNASDNGPGSFRQAIKDANAGGNRADTIVFDAAYFSTPREILVHNYPEQFSSVAGPLTVIGPGSSLLTLRAGILLNPVNHKALDSFAPVLTLSGMTVTGGDATGNGGGLSITANSNVTLEDVVFTNNVANNGGAIALSNNATLTLRNCRLTGNRALRGGAIYFFDGGSLVMENCTVSGNAATGVTQYDASGGGIYFFGAAKAAPLPAGFVDRTLLIRDSTFSGNTAGSSGGGVFNVTINQTATLTFENSTVTANSAGQTAPQPNARGGGGIARTGTYPGAIHVTNSVVAGNFNTGAPDILAHPQSPVTARFSAIGNPTGFTPAPASGSNVPYGTALLLGPLANHGGRTLTHQPQAGSPLINAGSTALVPPELVHDQRGPGFPRVVGAAVDIGAVESSQGAPPPQVTGVYVGYTGWTGPFRNYLQALGVGTSLSGYAVPGGADQLAILPWVRLNRLSVSFSQPVSAGAVNLAVTGVTVANYPVVNYLYDSATRTATWFLGQPLLNDRVTLRLDADPGGVSGASGRLDGEWAEGADAFPSGDGAAGGDFVFRLRVLPGDVDRNGLVVAADASEVKRKFFTSTANVGSGLAAYSIFHDVDGSGSILADDFSEVKRRFFTTAPAATAATRFLHAPAAAP